MTEYEFNLIVVIFVQNLWQIMQLIPTVIFFRTNVNGPSPNLNFN